MARMTTAATIATMVQFGCASLGSEMVTFPLTLVDAL